MSAVANWETNDDWCRRLNAIVQTMREMSRQTDPQEMVRSYARRMQQVFDNMVMERRPDVYVSSGPWREFLAQDAMADLDALDFVARAITPPMVPKRFDARFFMAEADFRAKLERGEFIEQQEQVLALAEELALGFGKLGAAATGTMAAPNDVSR